MFGNRRRIEAANDALARLATTDEERRAISILKGSQAGGAGLLGRLLTGRSYTESLAEELRRTGSSVSPASFVQVCLLMVVIGITLGLLFGSVIFAAGFAAVGAIAPFLWIKRPGESDGPCHGGPAAGTWWPEYALGLAQRAAY